MNYFQRPELKKGESISASENDKKQARDIFKQVVDILKPNIVIFLSSKSYKTLGTKKYDYVNHPTCRHWWNDNGEKKFKELIQRQCLERNHIQKIIDDDREKKQNVIQEFYRELAQLAGSSLIETQTPKDEEISDACTHTLSKGKGMGLCTVLSKNKKHISVCIYWRLYIRPGEKTQWEYVYLNNGPCDWGNKYYNTINCKHGGAGFDTFASNYKTIAKAIADEIQSRLE